MPKPTQNPQQVATIFFVNWLFRAGASDDREREAEDRAREYFDRHGHWPD